MGIGQSLKDIKRMEEVLSVLVKYGFGYVFRDTNLERKWFLKENIDSKKLTVPIRIRMAMDELGGSFVKLGQLLSIRADLVGFEIAEELKKLQDQVAPFPSNKAKEIIENELRMPIKSVFTKFEEQPVASASIGQAHKATLKSGAIVIVKVQRPDIKENMFTDLDIMKKIAEHLKENEFFQKFKIQEILNEFEDYTKNELDYMHEARNINEFYINFKNDLVTKIPQVFWKATTSRILTLEYIKGWRSGDIIKDKKSKLNKKLIAKNIAISTLKQILKYGFFHADPHPGNIFIISNNRIAYIDFGICGRVNNKLKKQLASLITDLINKDLDGIIEDLFSIGFVPPEIDKFSLREEIENKFSQYYNVSIDQINLGNLFKELIDFSLDYNIQLPHNFILLAKALITAQSVTQELDHQFNFTTLTEEYITNYMASELTPKKIILDYFTQLTKAKRIVEKLPNQADSLINKLISGNIQFKFQSEGLEKIGEEINKSGLRRTYGLILATFLIISTIFLLREMTTLSYIGYGLSLLIMIKLFKI